jgi:hypothetical protein
MAMTTIAHAAVSVGGWGNFEGTMPRKQEPAPSAPKEARIYQSPIRMDAQVRARLRAVCYHEDMTKQAFLLRAVLRALDEAEERLGITRKHRPTK